MFATFAGDELAFLLRTVKGAAGGKILNLTLQGYLLDEDEEYVYIGITPEEISGAIKKADIATFFKGSFNLNTEEFEIPEGTEVQ